MYCINFICVICDSEGLEFDRLFSLSVNFNNHFMKWSTLLLKYYIRKWTTKFKYQIIYPLRDMSYKFSNLLTLRVLTLTSST